MLHVDFLSKLEINDIIWNDFFTKTLTVRLVCMQKVRCSNPSRDGPKSYNRVVTVPLLNALQ